MTIKISPLAEHKMTINRLLLIKYIVFIGLLSFVIVVGYNFITDGIHDAVIFSPVIDDFMWGTVCSLIGAVSFVIALKNKSVLGKFRYVVQGALFSVGGLTMLLDGIKTLF
ncbi:hypothetical protein DZ860_22670 [Vibrio sinensis]|uniref:Uncharacterized protein n=1 Tax=Vibrio sinensis TaxID=2302434 RepID=A0A3A6Q4Z4_9VIBR|nr:hypothetical protein [Vibrio sinensis]RJX65093.1 hypothetical protein DZ860_22670 [Vibrio sinensis]